MKRVALLAVLALGLWSTVGCQSGGDKPAQASCACKSGCNCGHCSGSGAACTCKK